MALQHSSVRKSLHWYVYFFAQHQSREFPEQCCITIIHLFFTAINHLDPYFIVKFLVLVFLL